MKTHHRYYHLLWIAGSVALTLLLSLTLLGGKIQAVSQDRAEQNDPLASNQVFLPLIVSGQGSNPQQPGELSPYATMLTQATERCKNTAVNQACLANGAADGFTQIGDTLAVTPAMTLSVHSSVVSSVVDVANWAVVLIRLQAPGDETITQTLDLLAVGYVDVSVLQFFTSTEVAPGVPIVRFVSQPLQNGTQRAPSGLILQNRSDDELLSLDVNGAEFTLDGTVFLLTKSSGEVQSADALQAANEMIVNISQRSAMVQAAGESSAVVAGSRVKLALDSQGIANTAPSEPEPSDDDLLVPDPEDAYKYLSAHLFISLVQCRHAHNPRRVYRIYYYIHQLRTTTMRALGGEQTIQGFAAMIKQCARFEVIFDSTLILDGTLTWLNQVHSDGTFIQFDIDGKLVARATSPVRHLQLNMSIPVCTFTSSTAKDGTFAVEAASLKLFYNTFKISMQAFPHLEQYTANFTCPSPAPPLVLTWEFNSNFVLLHPDLWLPQPIYVLNNEHWKVTGRQIFAEAIFAERSAPAPKGTLHGNSYFILRHAPVEQ